MIKIYHNPRCKKSRAGLDYLQSKEDNIQIVKYLNETLSAEELKEIIAKTGKPVEEMLRKQEDYYKKHLKGKGLDEEQLIEEMAANPKLIQRPIVEKSDKAVLGQPPEEIDKLL